MKALVKFFGIISVIFLLVVWFFFDNIKGYYAFKEYCEKDGGLKVYESLEKNVGWWAKDKTNAWFTASLDHVGFVRYLEKDSQYYDLKPIGSRNTLNPEHEVNRANLSVEPIYKLELESHSLKSPHEPSRVTYQVKRLLDDKVVVKYNIFHYGFFDSEKTPMNVNQKYSCFDESVGSYLKRWESEINASFK